MLVPPHIWYFVVVLVCKSLLPRAKPTSINIGLLLETDDNRNVQIINNTMHYIKSKRTGPLRTFDIQWIYRETWPPNAVNATMKVCEMLQEGIHGLISFSSCTTMHFLESQTNEFHIPHITVHSGHCTLVHQRSFTFSIHPSPDWLPDIIVDIAKRQKWAKVIVLFDEIVGENQPAIILSRLSDAKIKTIPFSITAGKKDYRGQLKETLRAVDNLSGKTKHVLVLLHGKSAQFLIENAADQKMVHANYYWVIPNPNLSFAALRPLIHNNTNLLIARRSYKDGTTNQCHGDLSQHLRMSCGHVSLQEAYLADSLMAMVKTFDITAQQGFNTTIEPSLQCFRKPRDTWSLGALVAYQLKNIHFPGLVTGTWFNKAHYNGNAKLQLYSSATKNGNSYFTEVGQWDRLNGLQVPFDNIFANSFHGFDNQTLLVAAREATPFTTKITFRNNSFRYEGFCIEILDELSRQLHFKYQIVEPKDGLWGAPKEDGSGEWNGLVGMVMKQEVAFAIGPLSITSQRERVIDFTKPFMEDGAGIVVKKPDGDSHKVLKIFMPFHPYVWLLLGGATLVVGVILFLINKHTPYSAYTRRRKGSTKDEVGFRENLWFIFASLMDQGGETHPRSVSGRIVVGFWWLFTILIISSYTANLAAFLTVTIVEKPIKSLEDLERKTEYHPTLKRGTNLYSLFKGAKKGIYHRLWKRISQKELPTEDDEGLQMAVERNYAFMTDKSLLEYIAKQNCNSLSLADDIFNTGGFGFMLPTNAVYLDAFSNTIIKMQEAGLIEHWHQKWWRSDSFCGTDSRVSKAKTLDLDSVSGAFFVLLASSGAALVFLTVEYAYSRNKSNYHPDHSNDTPDYPKESGGVNGAPPSQYCGDIETSHM